MSVIATGSAGSTTPTSGPQVTKPKGIGGLTADDFMKLLIAQLKSQDPTDPMKNEDLLNQVSTMRELQANVELSDTLKSILGGQQLTTAASIIGKQVKGTVEGRAVSGIADRAFITDGVAYVGVGSKSIALKDLLSVSEPGLAPAGDPSNGDSTDTAE